MPTRALSRTAEFVSPEHPDKRCDYIADVILDALLEQDADTRSALEVLAGHGSVVIIGELTTKGYVDIPQIAREAIGEPVGVLTNIVRQSPEIASGVDSGGAGDQGVMVGYACNDNEEMVPQEYFLARKLTRFLYAKKPHDGKVQVTLDRNGNLTALVVSWASTPRRLLHEMIEDWLKKEGLRTPSRLFVNPAGDWSISGFDADTGLSGRKIVIDSYGPHVPVGGGSFSGKDATKVDRSAAYAARAKAVELLTKEKASEVFVRLAYAIGEAAPVMMTAYIDGTEHDFSSEKEFFTPHSIIDRFHLKKPQFAVTAQWGHFGNGFLWDSR